MRYTWSQACIQAAEEAQVSLLQAIETSISSFENLEISTPLLPIPEDIPLESVITRYASISTVAIPSVPSIPSIIRKKIRLPPTGVLGLPVLGLKQRQEQYGVALCVQCVTLLDAGIPLDVICS